MSASKIILGVMWVLCVAGLLTDFDQVVWRFLRQHGMGDHALGVLFVWIPVILLGFMWCAVLVLAVLVLRHFATRKTRGNRSQS